jgi:hypothetical protein
LKRHAHLRVPFVTGYRGTIPVNNTFEIQMLSPGKSGFISRSSISK